jgi:hypothetical protein
MSQGAVFWLLQYFPGPSPTTVGTPPNVSLKAAPGEDMIAIDLSNRIVRVRWIVEVGMLREVLAFHAMSDCQGVRVRRHGFALWIRCPSGSCRLDLARMNSRANCLPFAAGTVIRSRPKWDGDGLFSPCVSSALTLFTSDRGHGPLERSAAIDAVGGYPGDR